MDDLSLLLNKGFSKFPEISDLPFGGQFPVVLLRNLECLLLLL